MRITVTFILVLFFSFENIGFSQELILPNYKQYGLKDGLPQIQITTLFQDSRDYIWAGTNNGAAIDSCPAIYTSEPSEVIA